MLDWITADHAVMLRRTSALQRDLCWFQNSAHTLWFVLSFGVDLIVGVFLGSSRAPNNTS
jgi:hypothetical protein